MSGAQPAQAAGVGRLLQAVQELSLVRSLAEIQLIVRQAARQLVGSDGATFVLRDGDQCFYADEDAIAPLWKGSRFPLEACISGWAMLHREAVVIPDIYADARIPHDAYQPTFVQSLAMVPIRRLEPVGAIGVYWAEHRLPSADEVALLQGLADSTSVAMENVALYTELEQRVADRTAALELVTEEIRQLSLTDDLTGLSNRRGFFHRAEEELRRSCAAGGRCLLAFLDIDNLKWVNDTHGHDAGDALLTAVARVLRSVLEPAALIARLSGDEFCVLVTDAVQEPADLKAQMLDAVARFNDLEKVEHQLSVSVGVIAVSAADAGSLDELLTRADELMYADKKSKNEPAVKVE
ncbi:diguanylate cyclase domain-containing protein [Mycolicibacterium vaccae]|uniref:GGDEF domain-containing protein n=1 Tax=Mycolicibacterium vaccae TaxID=1810 RepID=UPI003D0724A3